MNQIYQALCVAEQAVNAVWPYVLEKAIAEQELEKRKIESKNNYSNYKPGVIMLKICIPVAIICFILTLVLPRGLFGSLSGWAFTSLFIGILALAGVLTGVTLKATYGKKYKEAENKIPAIELKITDAQARLDEAKRQNKDGLALAAKLIPPNALDPSHIRIIMSYFETGRVKTMAEALPLIEQQLHREEMERLQKEQITATEEARKAIERVRYYK